MSVSFSEQGYSLEIIVKFTFYVVLFNRGSSKCWFCILQLFINEICFACHKKKVKPNQTKTWIILLNQDIGTESVSKYLFELPKLLCEIKEIKPNHNQTEFEFL